MPVAVASASPASSASPPVLEHSLEAVRAVIPERCYQRSTAKGLAYIARDLVFHALVLTGLALTDRWWLVLPLWVLSWGTVSAMFVLAHDAAHGALFESRRLNGFFGRLLMIPSLHVYEAWVLGHNRIHHGHTVRQGMDFVWHPLTAEDYGRLRRFGRLRHRLEWSFLGSGAYYAREVWWNKMITFDPPEKFAKAIKRDWWLVIGAAAAAFLGAGALGWAMSGSVAGAAWIIVKLLVVPALGFLHVIGWTVYVHHVSPDIRWWTRREWNKFRGQMEGTTVLRMPRAINWLFFHNIFVHVPHHVDMRIPFYELPRAATAIEAAFEGVVIDKRMRVRDFLRSARECKLYDFEAGRWHTYGSAGVAAPAGPTA